MQTETEKNIAWIQSPVGWLKLVEQNGHLVEIAFVNEAPVELLPASTTLLKMAVTELEQYFDGQLNDFSVLTAQPGTAFQQRVWTELEKIPFGKTTSYMDMAIRLGDEKCIRAAASANGKNNLAIVVPCHRVIGSNGSLTGYAGGLWRKKWLLEHEAKHSGGLTQASLGF